MAKKILEIECPECGEILDINEQISQQLIEENEDEMRQMKISLRKELQESHSQEINLLNEKLGEQNSDLLRAKDDEEKKNLLIQKMEHELGTKDQKSEVEREKAVLEAKKEAMEEYQKMAEDVAEQKTAQLKIEKHQLQDQMRQQKELHEEALRKARQGSVQTQGEGGEIYIEDLLSQEFPSDGISEVAKGAKGADVIQSVRSGSGAQAGLIIWEGKRTKAWSNSWISKVKEDTVRANGHISVIVSDVMPSGNNKMTMIEDNVWICKYTELLGLATALRAGLIRAANAIKSQEGKGSKMELLYDYMAGQEFVNEMRLINDSYVAEIEIIAKERRSMERNWKGREKAANARLRGFTEFMGTIKTIATELPAIKEIEGDDNLALPSPDDEESI